MRFNKYKAGDVVIKNKFAFFPTTVQSQSSGKRELIWLESYVQVSILWNSYITGYWWDRKNYSDYEENRFSRICKEKNIKIRKFNSSS